MEDVKHGSPYDRGMADAYYGRRRDPHYWPEGTYKGHRIGWEHMSNDEIVEYNKGYDDQVAEGDFKDWG